jgi:hypothetical protein
LWRDTKRAVFPGNFVDFRPSPVLGAVVQSAGRRRHTSPPRSSKILGFPQVWKTLWKLSPVTSSVPNPRPYVSECLGSGAVEDRS